MKIEVVLSIIGGFGTLGLTVNAFFLRGIFIDLNTVKVRLAEMSARSESKELRIANLETSDKEIFERLNRIERSIS